MGRAGEVASCAGQARAAPEWSYRDIVEAVLYLPRGGLPWRMLPPTLFPAMTTVQYYFYQWRDNGLWQSITTHS